MKRFFILNLLIFNLLAEQGNKKVVVDVQGMVCAFCAQGIEKNFTKLSAVKETKVNLDNMEVTILLNENQSLEIDKIKEVVTNAGFKFIGVKK